MRIKQLLVIAAGAIAVASVALAQVNSYTPSYTGPGANIIFQDNFSNGSTVNNNTGMPQANSAPYYNATSYDVNTAKGGAMLTDNINPGDLQEIITPPSSSAFQELIAPINTRANIAATSLAGQPVGSFIDVLFEFTDTANVLGNSQANSDLNQLNIGLFDSQGSGLPNPSNLATISTATGGTQFYVGYYSTILQGQSGTSSKLYYRNMQNTGTGDMTLTVNTGINGAQRLPQGTSLVNGAAGSTMATTNGAQYTEDFRITLNAVGQVMVSNEVFAGIGTTGTCEYAFGGYTNAADPEFDTLAFSIASKDSGIAMTQDISFIQVTTDFVPEPSTWLMLVSGLAVAIAFVSRRRR